MDMGSLARLGDEELLAVFAENEVQRSALYAQGLALLAEIDSRGLACDKGYRDSAALAAELLRVNRRDTAERVAQARALLPSRSLSGAVVDPLLPCTGQAAVDGEINPEQVRAIHDTVTAFPSHATDDDRAAAETILLQAEKVSPPRALARLGREILARLDQDGTPPEDAALACPRRELRLHTKRDGRVTLKGELDAEAGALLTTLLSPLAAPRPAQDGQFDPRSRSERHGDALADILQLAASSADAPTEAGEPVNLHVTIGLDQLRDQVGVALLDGAPSLTASQARRIACDANIIPTAMGSNSEVLDIGRKTRVIPTHIRRALILRDSGCAFPGCDRPPKQANGHHVRHWAAGGPTALHNLVLLCGAHHRLVHHSEWEVRIIDGTPEFIPPQHVDRHRTPRRNLTHRTDLTGVA